MTARDDVRLPRSSLRSSLGSRTSIYCKIHTFLKMFQLAIAICGKIFFSEWQKRKQEEIVHPFLEEKIPWGLVPYTQALLLAQFIRGDLDAYPPFFKK